ncbi:MAG TPA: ZIP family metal transporter [Thermoanaerobaculia bacterium]|nr:ZIP family metal transporter [Thermoanaerobaculia bacterium]
MIEALAGLHPVVQALTATGFTWGVTALGAALVFFTRKVDQRLLDGMNGFAAGVMIAASYWSLLAPAIEMSERSGMPSWLPPTVGFVLGAAALSGADKVLPHLHPGLSIQQAEGPPTQLRRSVLLVLAITLHNIPEGLAVGVAFAAAALAMPESTLPAAVALAVGIGLQNFPEGVAVAMPLRAQGFSRLRSFWYGQLSAAVEPLAGVAGAAAVLLAQPLLPYALAFAAGAMLFVVVEELIPASQRAGNTDLATLSTISGFTVMMVLDLALG